MKEIKLTQGKVSLVDDEDFEYLNQWKWCAQKSNHTYYAVREDYSSGHKKRIKMHRLIMGTLSNYQVDHAFHDGLDNRKFIEINGELKINLRNCTHRQNCINKVGFGNSKYKGVYIQRAVRKRKTGITEYKYIRASIRLNNKTFYLGNFKTEVEAALVYDRFAKDLYGEFANLNFKSQTGRLKEVQS
jgi:hypothetical protein